MLHKLFAKGFFWAVIEKCPARVARGSLFAILVFLGASSISARAGYTAVVNPNSVLVTGYQGWGTSLCWWANVVGNYPNRTNFVDMAFSQLKLNIARYNIGGGENPSSPVAGQGYRTIMQGFEPTNGIWNWNADQNQRWILQQAEARGVNLVDAFANSPPWWMCVNSNCVGNASYTNNLQVACEVPFAIYLATVVSNLTVLDGDHFNYVTPMNEPNGSKWYSGSPSQEGCNMNPAMQSVVVGDLYSQLQTIAPSVAIDAAEDVDPQQTYDDLGSYSATSINDTALFSTHTYSFTGAGNLKSQASSKGKPLWMTEYGDSDASGLTMARYIYNDIDTMGAQAWCYWQVIDSARGWGFLLNSLLAPTNPSYTTNYTINEKFYVMGQFSEFIRPGCNIISVNDTNTLAAWNPTNSTLVLVLINNTIASTNVTYNLSDFGSKPWQVAATQTSASEKLTTLPALFVTNGTFSPTVPADSVTTFVLTTNIYPPVFTNQTPQSYTNIIQLFAGQAPTFSLSVTGTVPFYYTWFSNGMAVAGAGSAAYKPAVAVQGITNSYECIVTNIAGSATSMVWSVTGISAPMASYPQAVLALNPVSFWPLNEAEQGGGDDGVIALDYAGGNNGIYTNVLLGNPGYNYNTDPSATSALFGSVAINNSCAYDISGPDFSLPNGSNAEFTVSAWANSTGANGINTPTIAAKGYYYQEEYALDAGAPNSSFRFTVRNAAGTAYNANSTISLANTGQWYHLVGVCDEAHGLVMLYTNGVQAASVAIPTASGITNSSGTLMTIGARSSTPSAGFNEQFPGYISDVAIYNYALSSSQVQTLYTAASVPVMNLTPSGTDAMINYTGQLLCSTNIAGPWTPVPGAASPYVIPTTNSQMFYRVNNQ